MSRTITAQQCKDIQLLLGAGIDAAVSNAYMRAHSDTGNKISAPAEFTIMKTTEEDQRGPQIFNLPVLQ